MFTGLVETTGILRRRTSGTVARAFIECSLAPLSLGESIAVNGVCLTVDHILPKGFEADMSPETLEKTTLGQLALGALVHLERATPLGGRMGGHVVLGHVDGIGQVHSKNPQGEALRLSLSAPKSLARFVAPKGSIALDGLSLTVNTVGESSGDAFYFDVMLVPHTLQKTLLHNYTTKSLINIEVDVLARYVARQLEFSPGAPAPAKEQSHASSDDRLLKKLQTNGYL